MVNKVILFFFGTKSNPFLLYPSSGLLWSVHRYKWDEEFGENAQLFFYLADEGGNVLSVSEDYLNSHENSFIASGSRTDIGDWQLYLKSTVMSPKHLMVKY